MKSKTIDKIAIISAVCCALHCALLPILIGFTALAGLAIFKNPWIEYAFIVSGILLAFFSLGRSLKLHRDHTPARMATIGVVVLLISRLEVVHEVETVFTVFGALFLVLAHVKNIHVVHRFREEH
ncbi:MerC domain-containing protein [uncultured Dokdonia sp.]|uniref:MerC domain-containing protein n=1 Tax=uncultured Dokdonia sp. TaxID=575653 RepID=UPI00262F3458|nr:MerC domain-containing protein [uncultured Dokdonia sp.]